MHSSYCAVDPVKLEWLDSRRWPVCWDCTRKNFFSKEKITAERQSKEGKEMQLELVSKIMAGDESKKWLVEFSKQIDRLERVAGVLKTGDKKASAETEADDDAEESDDEDEEVVSTKKTKKKAALSDDDMDDEEETSAAADDEDDADESDDEDEEDAKPAKKTKAKKITLDDVNDAAKAYAMNLVKKKKMEGKEAREAVKAILKKKFKATSVTELDADDYAAAVEALAV